MKKNQYKEIKGSRARSKSYMKWQKGEYGRSLDIRMELPYPFLLLCRLVNETPKQLIRDFMQNLACTNATDPAKDDVRTFLVEYFIEQGYGRGLYESGAIRQIFAEMEAVGMLSPIGDDTAMLKSYLSWKEQHQRYWFKKWIQKQGLKTS